MYSAFSSIPKHPDASIENREPDSDTGTSILKLHVHEISANIRKKNYVGVGNKICFKTYYL